MSKTSPHTGDELPSYSESISSPQQALTLPQNIAQARSALVSSLLTTHITPHLHGSSLSGLSSSTLLLVPSNVSSLHPPSQTSPKDPMSEAPTFRGETIEGFYSVENLTIIRLQGRENSIEFWRQPAVIHELERQLQTKLREDRHVIVGDRNGAVKEASPNGNAKPRGGLFRKKSAGAEWKMPEVQALTNGEVRTGVEIRDICLRVENEMGLYETRTGKAVVVKVDAGG